MSGVLQKDAGGSGERKPDAQCEQVRPLCCTLGCSGLSGCADQNINGGSSPTLDDRGRQQELHRTSSVFELPTAQAIFWDELRQPIDKAFSIKKLGTVLWWGKTILGACSAHSMVRLQSEEAGINDHGRRALQVGLQIFHAWQARCHQVLVPEPHNAKNFFP